MRKSIYIQKTINLGMMETPSHAGVFQYSRNSPPLTLDSKFKQKLTIAYLTP